MKYFSEFLWTLETLEIDEKMLIFLFGIPDFTEEKNENRSEITDFFAKLLGKRISIR